MIRAVVATVLLAAGVAFITIAGIGVARLPDAFQRMHAATKAGGIGTSLVVLGVLVAGGVARPLTGVLTIAFMLLSLSVASQLLARAAYRMVRGPGYADRFVALDMLTAVVVSVAALTPRATGRGAFLDVGLGVALINFASTCAFAAFLERRRGRR